MPERALLALQGPKAAAYAGAPGAGRRELVFMTGGRCNWRQRALHHP